MDLLSKHSSIIGRLEMRILEAHGIAWPSFDGFEPDVASTRVPSPKLKPREAGSASTPSFKHLKLQQKVVRKRASAYHVVHIFCQPSFSALFVYTASSVHESLTIGH